MFGFLGTTTGTTPTSTASTTGTTSFPTVTTTLTQATGKYRTAVTLDKFQKRDTNVVYSFISAL
jgi:hypothetical protein